MYDNKNYNKNNKKNFKKNPPKDPQIPTRPVQVAPGRTDVCGYKMSEIIAQDILKKHPNEDPQKVLCEYVNEQCGLLYECIQVLTF
jgi:hypothetical protein